MPFRAGTAFLFYFQCMNAISLDGKILPADEPALPVANRGFRYGDALFETMKLVNRKVLLGQYHFERLFAGLQLLKIDIPESFNREKIISEIIQLCNRNKCEELGRVRLTVFRSDEPNNSLQYLIECWPLNDDVNKMNENGFV